MMDLWGCIALPYVGLVVATGCWNSPEQDADGCSELHYLPAQHSLAEVASPMDINNDWVQLSRQHLPLHCIE